MTLTTRRPGPTSETGRSARRSGRLASTQARFARRARAVRRRPWMVALLVVGALALAAGCVWLVWFSSVLTAREVVVETPSGTLSAALREDILRRADVPLGDPLVRVDTAAVAQRVVTQPKLAEATVSRSFPASVVITVVPRQPVLALRNSQGEVQLVDRLGYVYDVVPKLPEGVPIVTSKASPPTAEALRAAITVISSIPADLRADVTRVAVSSANLVTLDVAAKGRAVHVVWGGPADGQLKGRVVAILLQQKGVHKIDVSAPYNPVTT